MNADQKVYGPLHIYNGPSNLKELQRVNLTGAVIFFNGSYDLRELSKVNFMGATVFMNGQATVSCFSSSSLSSLWLTLSSQSSGTFSPPVISSERHHSDYCQPHDESYRPETRHQDHRHGRKRRRSDTASDSGTGALNETPLARVSSPLSKYPCASLRRLT